MKRNNKTCSFFTFGCKVNQYETQVLRERLCKLGVRETDKDPAVCIINTCTVTASAERKCRMLLKSLRKKYPRAQIILTGCYAQQLVHQGAVLPGVSRVIPQSEKALLPELIFATAAESGNPAVFLSGQACCDNAGVSDFAGHTRAFVKIQDGCDNYCAYCIVPFVRGLPQSRDAGTIVREVDRLSRNGFREIVLTGINIGAWQSPGREKLSGLLARCAALPSLGRIRLSSIEVGYVDDALLALMRHSDKICAHLHIPLQSGDTFILRRMNRRYSRDEYLRKVELIKKVLPAVSFTTDVIVGFPGEDDRRFRHTLTMIQRVQFARVHVFPFSPREGTKAAEMSGQVDSRVKRERKQMAEECARGAGLAFCRSMLGSRVPVLFEDQRNGRWRGYSDTYVPVSVPSAAPVPKGIIPVKIINVTGDDIKGCIEPSTGAEAPAGAPG